MGSQVNTNISALNQHETTDLILRSFYTVHRKLGFGFLEKVYENSMILELRKAGLIVEQQVPVKVLYDGVVVGHYIVDLLINGSIILELKAMECLVENHTFQLINYLKATDHELGFLLNFGRKAEFKRRVFSNDRKAL
jgi:GxxExxY protein